MLIIVVRLLWVYPAAFLPHLLPMIRKREPRPTLGGVFIVGWAGMRGAISLAAALALPFTLSNGQPFPGRSLIIYVTFCVIVATLLCQGLSLPWLVRHLGVAKAGAAERAELAREEEKIRLAAAQRVTSRLIQVAQTKEHLPHVLARLQDEYDYRIRQFTAHLDGDGSTLRAASQDLSLRLSLLQEERSELLRLRQRNEISDDVHRRIEHDLDLQEIRLKQGIFQWDLMN